MWMVPLSEEQVKYLLSKSNAKSQICVGVEPRRTSPSYVPRFGSKILIRVPYKKKSKQIDEDVNQIYLDELVWFELIRLMFFLSLEGMKKIEMVCF